MSCPRNSNCPARRASSCPRRSRSASPSSKHRSVSQSNSRRSQRSECDHLPRPIGKSAFYAHRDHADTSRLADDESSRYYDTSNVTEETSLYDSRSGRSYSDASSCREESDAYCSCRSRNCTLEHSATDSQRSLRGPNVSAIHGSGSKHRQRSERSERSDGTYTVSSRRSERSPRPVTSTPRHAAQHNNDKSKKSLLRKVLISNAKRAQDEETTPSRSRRRHGKRSPRSPWSKRHNNTRRSVSSSGSSKRTARRLFSDDSSVGLSTRLEFSDLGSDSLDRSLNSSIRSRNKSLSRRVLEKCELERSRQSCASPRRRTKQITCALSEPLHISTKQAIQISPVTGQLQVIATTAICCEAVDDESIASMLRYQPIICGKTSNHEGDDDSETTEQHVWIGRHSIYIERISNISKVRRAVKTKTEREYEAVCDSRLGAKTVVGPLSLLSTEITRQKNGRVQKTEYIQLVFPKGRIESFPETCDTVKAGEYVSMGEHVELRNNVLRIRRTVLLHRSNTHDDSVWDEDHLISNDQARDYRVADKNGRLTVTELVEAATAAAASPAPPSAESVSPLKPANAAASHELADTAIADSKEELRTAMSAGSATALAASLPPAKETEHKLRHVPEDKHNLAENLAAVYPRQVAFDKDNMKRTMEELKKRLQGERGLRALKENAVRLDSADLSDHQSPARPASAPTPTISGLLRGLQRDESESGKRRRAAEAHSVSMAADLFRYRTPSASRPPAARAPSPLPTTASERERVWGKQCKVTRKESVENNAGRAVQTTCPKMDLSKKSVKSKDSKAGKGLSRSLPITRTSSTVDSLEKNASACIDINTTGHMPCDVPNEVSVVKQLTLGCVINGVPWSLSVCFKLKMLPDQCDVVPTFITFDDKPLWSAPQAPAAAEHKPVPEKPAAPATAATAVTLVKDVKTEAVSPAAPAIPAQQQLSDSSIGQDSKSADSQKSDKDEKARAEEKCVSKKSGGSKRSKRKGSSKRSQRSARSNKSAKKADAPQ